MKKSSARKTWTTISILVLGALVGFSSQLLVDFMRFFATGEQGEPYWPNRVFIQVPIEGSSECWAFSSVERDVFGPLKSMPKDKKIGHVKEHRRYIDHPLQLSPEQKEQWQDLWFELLLLDWLTKRGAQASTMSLIGMLLAILIARQEIQRLSLLASRR